MPFVLRNAPSTFQHLMNKVLGGVKECEVYLDDIVTFSRTWSKHLETLRTIFSRLKQVSLTLNLGKCEFSRATVTYFEKQVRKGLVATLADKDFPVPQTWHELCRFFGNGWLLPWLLLKFF